MIPEQYKKQDKFVRNLARAYNILTEHGRIEFAVSAPEDVYRAFGSLMYFAAKAWCPSSRHSSQTFLPCARGTLSLPWPATSLGVREWRESLLVTKRLVREATAAIQASRIFTKRVLGRCLEA